MTCTFSNPQTRAHLSNLSAAIDEADASATNAAAALAEATERARALRQAIREHDAEEPAASPDIGAELSAALAANPQAASTADWTGKLREAQGAHQEALNAWNGKRTIIAQALSQVEGEVASAKSVADRAAAARANAMRDFVDAARDAMVAEMRPRWAAFVQDTLRVSRALHQLASTNAGERISFSENGVAIVRDQGAVVDWLFQAKSAMPSNEAGEVVAAIRADLKVAAKAKARG